MTQDAPIWMRFLSTNIGRARQFDATSKLLRKEAVPVVDSYGLQSSPVANAASNTAAFLRAFSTFPSKVVTNGYIPVAAIPAANPVRLHLIGQQASILLPACLKLFDGGGATLALTSSRGIIGLPYASYNYPEIRSDLGADVAAGDTTLTLAKGQGRNWSAGDALLYRFGSLPYDLPEPLQWGFGRVTDVAGDELTIDAPMPASFSVASVASQSFTDSLGNMGRSNKTIYKWPLLLDLTMRDLSVTGLPQNNVEIGVMIAGAQRLTIRNVATRLVGTGFGLQYVDSAVIDGCSMTDCSMPTNVSLNKGVSLAECRAVEIRDFACSGVISAVGAEASSEATVIGGHFHNTGNPLDGTDYGRQCVAFAALGSSQLTVRDFTVSGYGGYLLAETSNGVSGYEGQVRFEGRLTLIHDTMPAGFGHLIDMSCELDLRIAGVRELWDFGHTRWVTRRVYLRNGLYQNIGLPPGILRQARIYTSQGIVPGTNLTSLYIGRTNDNGSNWVAQLIAGKTVSLNAGEVGAVFTRRSEQLKLLVTTASGSALDAAPEFLDVDCEMVPDMLAPPWTWSSEEDERALGPAGGLREALFTGYDLPLIAAGAMLQVNFAITTMALGDLIEAASFGMDRTGITMRDVQCIAGNCRVVFENLTGAAIDLGPTNVRILWRKSLRG